MKIEIKKRDERKLVAVLGAGGTGFFVRSSAGISSTSIYIDERGEATVVPRSLESEARNSARTPIYEGDKITLTF